MDKFTKSILERFNFNLHLKLNGKKFVIPIIKNIGYDNLLLNDGLWMIDIFKKILPIKSGTFIDIGVNIGQTLLELKSVNDIIKYIGFEPNPACIFYCNNLIRKNNFKNSLVIPIGIYNESKVLSFDIFGGEAGSGSSLVDNLRPGYNYSEKIFVPVFPFDELDKYMDLNLISIIKIDVEGAEFEVLKSMQNILRRKCQL